MTASGTATPMPSFAPVERLEEAEPLPIVVGALPELVGVAEDVSDDVGEPAAVIIVVVYDQVLMVL